MMVGFSGGSEYREKQLNLEYIQKWSCYDLLMDQMWDMKERELKMIFG